MKIFDVVFKVSLLVLLALILVEFIHFDDNITANQMRANDELRRLTTQRYQVPSTCTYKCHLVDK